MTSVFVGLNYCNRRRIYLFSYFRCVCDNKTTSRSTCYFRRITGYRYFTYTVCDCCSIAVLWKTAEGSFPGVGFAQRQCLVAYSFVVRLELHCYAFRSCIPRLSQKICIVPCFFYRNSCLFRCMGIGNLRNPIAVYCRIPARR